MDVLSAVAPAGASQHLILGDSRHYFTARRALATLLQRLAGWRMSVSQSKLKDYALCLHAVPDPDPPVGDPDLIIDGH